MVGGIFVLGAIGLSLVYGVKNFANFAHGELMALGAYVAFTLNNMFEGLNVNIVLAAVVAFFVVALVGILLEYLVFRRLEDKGIAAPLIASFGLFFIIQNIVRILWGTSPRLYVIPTEFMGVPTRVAIPLGGGISLTLLQMLTLVVGLVMVTFLHILLKYTKMGKAMRATADNFELAKTTGIDTRLVIIVTWFIGAGFAAIAGVLLGMNTQLRPIMGFQVLLFLFAAVILGGIGSAYGALLGGMVIGITNEVSKFALFSSGISSAFSPAVVFGVMIITLILRPQGILGGEPILDDFKRIGGKLREIAKKVQALAGRSRGPS